MTREAYVYACDKTDATINDLHPGHDIHVHPEADPVQKKTLHNVVRADPMHGGHDRTIPGQSVHTLTGFSTYDKKVSYGFDQPMVPWHAHTNAN